MRLSSAGRRGLARVFDPRACVLVLLWACAGDDTVKPSGPTGPALAFVAGASGTDTVDTELRQALIVRVDGPDGKPSAGTIVRFQALSPADTLPLLISAFIGAPQSAAYDIIVNDTTDARGLALAIVRLGPHAGPARIRVRVPEYGLDDTARYVVTAGRMARVDLSPDDTMIAVGRAVTLHATTRDRHGNARGDSITYGTRGTACTASGATVTGVAPGNCVLTAVSGVLRDSASVGVVPPWTLMGVTTDQNGFQRIVRFSLASGTTTDVGPGDSYESYPAAHANGTVVFRRNDHLVLIRPDGTAVDPFPSGGLPSWSGWPRISRDAAYVYFAGYDGVSRAAVAGGSRTLLFPGTVPDPSPSGREVAFMCGGPLCIGDVSSLNFRQLVASGYMPRWSPNDSLIAFVDIGQVWVVRPDGSGRRAVSRPGVVVGEGGGLDWSPDGLWLIAKTGPLEIMKADGTEAYAVSLPRLGQVSIVR